MLIIHFPETKPRTFVHCRVLIILVAVSHAAVCHKFDVNRDTLLACKASVCAAYACLRKFLIPVSLLFCKAFDSIVCSPFRKACSKASFCPDSTGKASLSVRSLWVFARCCNAWGGATCPSSSSMFRRIVCASGILSVPMSCILLLLPFLCTCMKILLPLDDTLHLVL